MKRSLLIEIHPWRGVYRDSDLFMRTWTLGVVTVAWSRFLLTDKLRALLAALRKRP